MPITLFPADINYKLKSKALNGYWLCLHGNLKGHVWTATSSGYTCNKPLKERLARHGYFEQPLTPGLWKHVSRPAWFNLCVHDCGIKYIGCEHLQHLYNALQKETYKIVDDLEGGLYCGIALNWNYAKHHVNLAMVKCVMKQLTKYGHVAPLKP